jgi:MerR family transcriptional regulator, heat shock protein HspR
MRLGVERKQGHLPDGSLKIGSVAQHFNISVDLLRLYEREGLLIPLKSRSGTRYFMEDDFPWIETILRLVRQARLNFAGIRHLLALYPCWQVRRCGFESKKNCPVISDASRPCWANRAICPVVCAQDCYFCQVYRSAPTSEPLQALLVAKTDNKESAHYPVLSTQS